MIRFARSLVALCAIALCGACNRTPDDLREWRPSDHSTEPAPAQDAPQVSGSAEPTVPGLDAVTIAAWQRACVTCHGSLGRGDGPQGPMVQARDLSDPAWQRAASDAEIVDAITKGRGRMPPFQLPASTVAGLLHLVRLFNRERVASPASTEPARSDAGVAPTERGAKKASRARRAR